MNIDKIISTAESFSRTVLNPADENIQKARFAICSRCPFKRMWKTKLGYFLCCGKPIHGSSIRYGGKMVELCGCVMEQKVKDPGATCPIDKW